MGKNAVDPASSIPTFYAGSSIFITGATGFLGKVLIEKLLRSCPDIREIFLLIRPKVDANIDERLRQMLTNPVSSADVIGGLAKCRFNHVHVVCFSYLIHCGASNPIALTN